jgi:glycine/D-amino acid oxidase-like deaminating enzyme
MTMASAERPPGRQHAVVVGGGFAGLVVARVLADHFARVTVLEQDGVTPTPGIVAGCRRRGTRT